MSNFITGVQSRQPAAMAPMLGPGTAGPTGPSFKEFLLESTRQVGSPDQDAHRAVELLAAGGDANPAETLTAVQRADLALGIMRQIGERLVQAYQEVQNIRV